MNGPRDERRRESMDLLFFRTAVGQATFPRGLQSSLGSRAEWKTGVTWVRQDLTDVPARGEGEAPTMVAKLKILL